MTPIPSSKKTASLRSGIIFISIIGLILCITVLFPQVRRTILEFAMQFFHRQTIMYESWSNALVKFALGGIGLILFLDYCTLTASGRALVGKVKQEFADSLSEMDFRSLWKPLILMFVIYLLGILTLIRANFSYNDDIGRSIVGMREWYNFSRYVTVFLSYIFQPEISLTDISPIPQLLAAFILACSSVLLVYVLGNKKITVVKLLASIPLGLSPYFLECLAFKFDAPYMTLPILSSIIPFLFIDRKRAFVFASVGSLLIMCMTYQALSGVYLLIAIMLGFQDWNSRKKSNKEILSFLGTAAFAYGFALLLFKFFIMRSTGTYVSTEMLPLPQLIPGLLSNIKNFAITVNADLGVVWKAGIALVLLFFIVQSIRQSAQTKFFSFLLSILVLILAFIASYGIYSLLTTPLYHPRALSGFGIFLAIVCIYAVSRNGIKSTGIVVLALNWCFFVFAFSYGNALADQARYAEFRITLFLNDISHLYPNSNSEELSIQLENSIDFTPSVKNIAKQYPVIERLVQKRFGKDDGNIWDGYYYRRCFGFTCKSNISWKEGYIDFRTLNLSVVADTYYHTIQSDGKHILVTLKH